MGPPCLCRGKGDDPCRDGREVQKRLHASKSNAIGSRLSRRNVDQLLVSFAHRERRIRSVRRMVFFFRQKFSRYRKTFSKKRREKKNRRRRSECLHDRDLLKEEHRTEEDLHDRCSLTGTYTRKHTEKRSVDLSPCKRACACISIYLSIQRHRFRSV